ncbi:hypothetical protein [Lacticaseibacillus rhamnosus]|uniref:hypothetical protein n=1 Tax=Lacticaseibacillus rhamnosus TaxID=47715 RepID=UPI0006696FAA|nr:hypothetical protein [Lacticaseibacillus rhamnosus]GMB72214.1 hypothetical protein NCCP2648_14680 [Lacticaseibacillus rhamnosus]
MSKTTRYTYLLLGAVLHVLILNKLLNPFLGQEYQATYSLLFCVLFVISALLLGSLLVSGDQLLSRAGCSFVLEVLTTGSIELMYWKNFLEIMLYAVPIMLIQGLVLLFAALLREKLAKVSH